MIPPARQRFTAFVVFQGAEHRRAWRIFTRRRWRHCLVIVPVYYPAPSLTADVYALVINPITFCVRFDMVWRKPRDLVDEMLDEGYTAAIAVPVDHDYKTDYVPRGLLTCVSLVKAVIGVRAWYVWTPEHLARYLARRGCEIIQRKGKANVSTFQQAEEARQHATDRDAA